MSINTIANLYLFFIVVSAITVIGWVVNYFRTFKTDNWEGVWLILGVAVLFCVPGYLIRDDVVVVINNPSMMSTMNHVTKNDFLYSIMNDEYSAIRFRPNQQRTIDNNHDDISVVKTSDSVGVVFVKVTIILLVLVGGVLTFKRYQGRFDKPLRGKKAVKAAASLKQYAEYFRSKEMSVEERANFNKLLNELKKSLPPELRSI